MQTSAEAISRTDLRRSYRVDPPHQRAQRGEHQHSEQYGHNVHGQIADCVGQETMQNWRCSVQML
jgi:hypothetical protein